MLKEREIHLFERTWTTSCLVTKEIIKRYIYDENEKLRSIKISQKEIRTEVTPALVIGELN